MTSYGQRRVILSNVITDSNFTILINFSCELGKIMTRYDFLEARRVILINVFTFGLLLCKWGQIMTRYDFDRCYWYIQ